MKQWLAAIISLIIFSTTHAQTANLSNNGCATITTAAEMQEVAAYLSKKSASKTTTGFDTIPLSIHIVGRDDGTGYYRLDNLFTVICQLNDRYAPVGFYYYIQWPINYINNTSYYTHNFWSGANMMSQYNISNTINVYFVDDPSGACGYFAPGEDGVAIKKDCSNPNSTTLTHELGHYFGLPHTFYGWENGNAPSNAEKVTRGIGANCSNAGDLFCDTEADYLSNRWNCPYTGTLTDANGERYHPDSSLYMSYASDFCMSRFSDQQSGRMHDKLYNQRSYLLQGNAQAYTSLDTPSVIYPTDSVHSNNKIIKWRKVAGAQYYYVKITLKGTTLLKQETLVSDTVAQLNFPMIVHGAYTASIAPVSAINVCRKKIRTKDFIYTDALTPLSINLDEAIATDIKLLPNPANENVNIVLESLQVGNYTIQLTNITGQKMTSENIIYNGSTQKINLSLKNMPAGMYVVRVTGNSKSWTGKLLIQH